jgi:hypothetical protein
VVRPPKELKAFAKVHLAPGASTTVRFDLDDRAFAYWCPAEPDAAGLRQRVHDTLHNVPATTNRPVEGRWRVDPGTFDLHIGRSSADIAHVVSADIASGGAEL